MRKKFRSAPTYRHCYDTRKCIVQQTDIKLFARSYTIRDCYFCDPRELSNYKIIWNESKSFTIVEIVCRLGLLCFFLCVYTPFRCLHILNCVHKHKIRKLHIFKIKITLTSKHTYEVLPFKYTNQKLHTHE